MGHGGGFFSCYGGDFATVADRKSTRLNSSHHGISYAVFCLKKIAHQFSDSGNGSLRGPDQGDVNFSLMKDFRTTEAQAIQFRAELLNMFNLFFLKIPGPTNITPVPQALPCN